jgi:hypothetical protein
LNLNSQSSKPSPAMSPAPWLWPYPALEGSRAWEPGLLNPKSAKARKTLGLRIADLTISWFWPIILPGLKHELKEALLWPKFFFLLTN